MNNYPRRGGLSNHPGCWPINGVAVIRSESRGLEPHSSGADYQCLRSKMMRNRKETCWLLRDHHCCENALLSKISFDDDDGDAEPFWDVTAAEAIPFAAT